MDEILVYKSVIDNTASLKSVEDLRKANALLKKDLEQAGKVGSDGWQRINKTAQDTGKTFQEVNDSLKKQFTENKNKIDDFNRSLRQTSDGAGSINEIRQEVISLAREYDALSKAERDSAKGLELRDKLFTTTEALKELEAQTGRNQRNVGNYKQAFIGAFEEIGRQVPVIGKVIDPLKNMGAAFKDAGGGLQGFSAALLATGIPLFIAAAEAAISTMQKFDSISEGTEDTMKGLGKSFDYFISLGNQGNFQTLINGMRDAYNEGVKLSQEIRKIGESQLFLNVANVAAQKDVEALLIKSKDRTKSEEERIKMLDEASRIERENLQENLKLAQQRVDIADSELIKQMAKGLNDDEQRKADSEARAALINLQRESANVEEKIINRKNQLLEQIAQEEQARRDKAEADRKKKADDDEKEQKRIEKQVKDYNDAQEAKLNALKKADADRNALELKSEQDKLARESEAFSKQSAYISKQLELDLAAADLDIKNTQERERRKQEIKLMSLEKQLELTRQFVLADGIISDEEVQKLKEIELAIRAIREGATTPTQVTTLEALGITPEQMEQGKANLQTIQNAITSVQSIVSGAYQIRLNEIQSQYQAEIEGIEASSLSEEQKKKKITALKKQQAQEEYQVQLKQFKAKKAMDIISATINTALAVMNALATMPYPASLVFAALAAATGAVQIGVIASQKPPAAPKFAKGGLLSGPSHAQGGIKAGGVELEGDEMVVTKGAGRNVKSRSIASFINRMFGGVRYPGAQNLPNNLQNAIQAYVGHSGSSFVASTYGKFAAGGFVPSFPKLTTDQIGSNASLLEEMRGLRDAILGMPSPVVSVVEINKGQKQVNLIENAGTN